jgi:anti-sigma factor RsiW
MKCNTPRINEKLVQYVENLLPTAEMEEVRSHLQACEVCREERKSLTITTGLLKTGAGRTASTSSPCPDESLLVSFAEAPGSLKEGDRRMVARHVKKCSDCREALSLLGELDRELEKTAHNAPVFISMPEAVKKEARRLYGKEKNGLWQTCIQLFGMKPRYSLLSALAVTLLVVGIFSVLFNDMAGTRQARTTSPSINESPGLSYSTTVKTEDRAGAKPGAAEIKKASSPGEEKFLKDQVAQAPEGITSTADNKRERESTSAAVPPAARDERGTISAEGTARMPGAAGGAQAPSTSAKSFHRAGEAPFPGASADSISADKEKGKADENSMYAIERRKNQQEAALSGSRPLVRTEKMAVLQSQTTSSSPAESDRMLLEGQMKKKAESLVRAAIGMSGAAIEVTIVPVSTSKNFAIRRIEVVVKSSAPLQDEERNRIKEAVMAGLKLDAQRDSLIITERAAVQ